MTELNRKEKKDFKANITNYPLVSLQTSSSFSPVRAAFGFHLPYMDIYVPPSVIHHTDQIPECMTCFHFLISLPSMPPSLQRGGAGYACFVISAALVSLLLCTMAWFSQIPLQIYVNAHPLACGSRYEWRQPVSADGPDDVLTAINMANNR